MIEKLQILVLDLLFLDKTYFILSYGERGRGIEPLTAFTQKPSIRVEACGAHQIHKPSIKIKIV